MEETPTIRFGLLEHADAFHLPREKGILYGKVDKINVFGKVYNAIKEHDNTLHNFEDERHVVFVYHLGDK